MSLPTGTTLQPFAFATRELVDPADYDLLVLGKGTLAKVVKASSCHYAPYPLQVPSFNEATTAFTKLGTMLPLLYGADRHLAGAVMSLGIQALNFYKATRIFNQNPIWVIDGPPGAGKTLVATLASAPFGYLGGNGSIGTSPFITNGITKECLVSKAAHAHGNILVFNDPQVDVVKGMSVVLHSSFDHLATSTKVNGDQTPTGILVFTSNDRYLNTPLSRQQTVQRIVPLSFKVVNDKPSSDVQVAMDLAKQSLPALVRLASMYDDKRVQEIREFFRTERTFNQARCAGNGALLAHNVELLQTHPGWEWLCAETVTQTTRLVVNAATSTVDFIKVIVEDITDLLSKQALDPTWFRPVVKHEGRLFVALRFEDFVKAASSASPDACRYDDVPLVCKTIEEFHLGKSGVAVRFN